MRRVRGCTQLNFKKGAIKVFRQKKKRKTREMRVGAKGDARRCKVSEMSVQCARVQVVQGCKGARVQGARVRGCKRKIINSQSRGHCNLELNTEIPRLGALTRTRRATAAARRVGRHVVGVGVPGRLEVLGRRHRCCCVAPPSSSLDPPFLPPNKDS